MVPKGKKRSSLYLMQTRSIDSSINVVDDDNTIELWYNRLGHMSEKGLIILAKTNLLASMKNGSLKRCAHCLAGKQTRVAFKTHRHTRKPCMLDLVYYDVCGPMKTKTLGGYLSFMTFIDDHSRKIWVYTMTTKDQVLDVFKQFHALVERQSGEKLKCIWTDNWGE